MYVPSCIEMHALCLCMPADGSYSAIEIKFKEQILSRYINYFANILYH